MARKPKHEEHENHERWLISYADFITLLFAFFVVMYSVSSVNEGKYRVLSDSLVAAFRSSDRSIEPIQIGDISKTTKQPGLLGCLADVSNLNGFYTAIRGSKRRNQRIRQHSIFTFIHRRNRIHNYEKRKQQCNKVRIRNQPPLMVFMFFVFWLSGHAIHLPGAIRSRLS